MDNITEFVDGLGLRSDYREQLIKTIYDAALITERAAVKSGLLVRTIPGFVETLTGDKEKGEALSRMVKDVVMEAVLASYENVKG